MAGSESATGLCLVIEAQAGAIERLSAALGVAAASSVVLRPAPGATLDAQSARPLVELAQRRGAAALIEADARLARTLRADGVHLPPSEELVSQYEEARSLMGGRCIVGVAVEDSRHDAMSLAEAGADYIGFGLQRGGDSGEAARQARLDLVAWWAEIFEVPCIAFDVEEAGEAAALVRAGADFLGLALPAGSVAADAAGRVEAVTRAIASVRAKVRG